MQQASSSFQDINAYTWHPTDVFDAIVSMISSEVSQGLWNNSTHSGYWCCLGTSTPEGVNNGWVRHQYRLMSGTRIGNTIVEVLWPNGWEPPAPNIQGNLPTHFFGGGGTGPNGGTVSAVDPSQHPAPANKPGYKLCSECP